MKNTSRILKFFSALFVVVSFVNAPVYGDFTYVVSGFGSGTLGSNSFSDAEFRITAQGDETQVTNPLPHIFNLEPLDAVLEVDGIGTADFLTQLNLAVNQGFSPNPAVGFGDPNQDVAIFFVSNPVFGSYDLQTTYPLTVGTPSAFNPRVTFPTTMGDFSVTDASSATFQSVPEPVSLLIFAIGVFVYLLRQKTYASPMAPTAGRGIELLECDT